MLIMFLASMGWLGYKIVKYLEPMRTNPLLNLFGAGNVETEQKPPTDDDTLHKLSRSLFNFEDHPRRRAKKSQSIDLD